MSAARVVRGLEARLGDLAILKGAGIVQDEKRGSMVYYRLRGRCVLNFFECVESVLECNAKERLGLLA